MTTSLPYLVEVVFKEVENKVKTGDKTNLSDEALLSLHSVLGATLLKGLEILDKQRLIAYHTVNKQRTIVEIKGDCGRCYRVFPYINFCPCLAFKHQVLEKKLEITCKHVVAARISLMLDNLIHDEITNEQYIMLLKSMLFLEEEN